MRVISMVLVGVLAAGGSAAAAKKAADAVVDVNGCGPPGGDQERRLVKMRDVQVQGALDKAIVRRVVRQRMPQLKYCFEKRLLVKPELAGTVAVAWSVGADGAAGGVKASGLGDDEIEACFTGVFKALRFPKPDGGGLVTASTSFVLGGDKVDPEYHVKKLPDAIRKQLASVRACFAKTSAADPGASAVITVTFAVSAAGVASDSEPNGYGGDQALYTCVRNAVVAMKLPHVGDETASACAFVMAPKGAAWSLDAARKAGAVVVRLAADKATIDGTELALAAPEGLEPPPRTIHDELVARTTDQVLPVLILEIDAAASAAEAANLAGYADEVRVARLQGKAWVGVPMHLLVADPGIGLPTLSVEIAPGEVRFAAGEDAAVVIGKPGDKKKLQKGFQAARKQLATPYTIRLNLEDGVPWSAVLAVLDAAHTAGYVEAIIGWGMGVGGPRGHGAGGR